MRRAGTVRDDFDGRLYYELYGNDGEVAHRAGLDGRTVRRMLHMKNEWQRSAGIKKARHGDGLSHCSLMRLMHRRADSGHSA